MRKINSAHNEENAKYEIIAFRYGTDVSYMRRSSPDDVWKAIIRRAAWDQAPLKMIIVSIVQLVLCIITVGSQNAPINISTLIMAIIFVGSLIASNPLDVSQDLLGYILKFQSKLRLPTYTLIIICILISPVLSILFGVTLMLDLLTGEILDMSYGSMINILVNTIVVSTGVSVGLRSGSAISAIQTFAGKLSCKFIQTF